MKSLTPKLKFALILWLSLILWIPVTITVPILLHTFLGWDGRAFIVMLGCLALGVATLAIIVEWQDEILKWLTNDPPPPPSPGKWNQ